jgi:hypothetical protein
MVAAKIYAHKNVSSFVPYVYSLGLFFISTILDDFVVSYSPWKVLFPLHFPSSDLQHHFEEGFSYPAAYRA